MCDSLEKQLAGNARISYLQYGSEVFFTPDKAFEFVDLCEDKRLVIIGIEGFILVEESVQPRTDIIGDFSACLDQTKYSPLQCYLEVRKFLGEYKNINNILFNFVVS